MMRFLTVCICFCMIILDRTSSWQRPLLTCMAWGFMARGLSQWVGSLRDSFDSFLASCFNALACFMIPAFMLEGYLESALV